MRSPRKWGILVSVLVIVGSLLRRGANSSPHSTSQLSGLRALLDEKLPKNRLLARYQEITSRNSITQTHAFESAFILHPSFLNNLLSGSTLTGTDFLQGTLDGDITMRYLPLEGHGETSGRFFLDVVFANEPQTSSQNSNEQQVVEENVPKYGFNVTIDREGSFSEHDLYLMLTNITFSKHPKLELPLLEQWYFLLNRYRDTWVHLPRTAITASDILFPDRMLTFLSTTDKKVRMLPDQADGRLYLMATDQLTLSGHAVPVGNDLLNIAIPHYALTFAFEQTQNPDLINVIMTQDNIYKGAFTGETEINESRNSYTFTTQGEFVRPGGISGKLAHTLTQKKGPSLLSLDLPRQFLRWEELKELWKQEEKR